MAQPTKDFYVKLKNTHATFVDHETGVTLHGTKLALVTHPIGKLTGRWLRAGGLVKATDKEVADAQKNDNIVEGDAFTPKTKIVMVSAGDGTVAAAAGMLVPKEVPLDHDPEEVDTAAEDEENAHYTDDNDEEVDESEPGLDDLLNDKDAPKHRKDGKKPGFAKVRNGVINAGDGK